ncbi:MULTISPECIES: hypothetical protein [unclassified Paenibacillus]|uniref:hypothetical protein n=1 Tax=unclassified Paenibacillus TaxID=185978 RepID=UPI0009AD491A|nr:MULTISPECIES: hypothetical protein [unclassified Paenibacillus]MBE1443741.1 transcriptional regulator NrdR family protein [Paenibacillus sp. OAS669]
MSEAINEQELVQFIADKTKVDEASIRLVLKHEQTFINNAKEDDIDSDEIVDYVMSRKDVKLDELTVETILDLEMDYLTEKGIVTYID